MFDFFKKKKNDEEENSKKNLSDENNLEKSEENEKIQESRFEETIEENFENENSKQLQDDDTDEELGFFTKLSKGLSKTREQFSSKLKNLFTANVKIDDDLYDELEEILISADIGMKSTIEIVDQLKDEIKEKSVKNADEIFPLLKEIMEKKIR